MEMEISTKGKWRYASYPKGNGDMHSKGNGDMQPKGNGDLQGEMEICKQAGDGDIQAAKQEIYKQQSDEICK